MHRGPVSSTIGRNESDGGVPWCLHDCVRRVATAILASLRVTHPGVVARSAPSWRSSTRRSSTSRSRHPGVVPGPSIGDLSWVLNAYNIVFAAFLIVCGRLTDLIGRRRLSSRGSRCSRSPRVLCAPRGRWSCWSPPACVQALGAALLVPASLALVVEAFPATGEPTRSASGAPRRPWPPGSARRSVAPSSSWAAGVWAFLVNLPFGVRGPASPPPNARREPRARPTDAARPPRRARSWRRAGPAHLGDRQGQRLGLDQPARARRVRLGGRCSARCSC